MTKYFSRHDGEVLDDAIDFYLNFKALGTNIIPSTKDDPFDVDNLKDQGNYIIQFTQNVYGGSSDSPIEIKVFHPNETTTIQRYEKDGVTYQREYDHTSDTWTEWSPLKDFLVVEEDEKTPAVATDTLVLRHIEDANEFFKQNEKDV